MPRNGEAQIARLSIKQALFVRGNQLAHLDLTCIGALTAVSSEHMDSTPQEVFDSMRGNFQASKAKGVHARYQWDLSGPEGGQWWIDVNDGNYKMGKEKSIIQM